MKKIVTLLFTVFVFVAYSQEYNKTKKTKTKIITDYSDLEKLKSFNTRNFKKVQSRSATKTDTFVFSYFNYAANKSETSQNIDFNYTISSGGQNFPRSLELSNFIGDSTLGYFTEITVSFDTLVWNGIVTSQGQNIYIDGGIRYDSSSVFIDSLYLPLTALFCDTNKLNGDSIVISIHEILNDTAGTELKRFSHKNKIELMKFYNEGRYYTHRQPVSLQLGFGQRFAIKVRFYTDDPFDNYYALNYGYLDSCKNVTIDGQNFLSPAHSPFFPGLTSGKNIGRTTQNGPITERFTANNFAFNIPSIPSNCRFVNEQEINLSVRAFVTSKLSAVIAPAVEDFKKVVYCKDEKMSLIGRVVGGLPPYTYKWNTSNGTLAPDTGIIVELTTATTSSNITLEVTDANNDKTIVNYTVLVSNPTVNITSSKTSISSCVDSVILTASGSGSFEWSNGVSGTNRVIVKDAGSYSVALTNSFGCKAEASRNISGYISNTVDFTYNPSSNICPDVNVSFTPKLLRKSNWNYTWLKDGTDLSSDELVTEKFDNTSTSNKTYKVKLTIDSSVCKYSVEKNVVILPKSNSKCTSSISNKDVADLISVYPNPAPNGEFTLSNATGEAVKLNVVDLLGKVVYTKDLGRSNEYQVAIPNVKSGIYFVEVISNKGTFTQKLNVNANK
jgi:hypothetical protein